MDSTKALLLAKLADEQIALSRKYSEARIAAGEAETNLKLLLAAKALKTIRGNKKNVGIDMAILMFCEDSEEARDYYRTYITKRAEYKSLEKLIEAIDKKLSYHQSIMKYFRENG